MMSICSPPASRHAATRSTAVVKSLWDKIPLKSTKSTQGVQVMKLTKKGAKMCRVVEAKDSGIDDLKHYTTKNIPAAGSFLKKNTDKDKQISLFSE